MSYIDPIIYDAFDLGNRVSNSGTNADGDIIVEYHFTAGGGSYLGYPTLDWNDYEMGQVALALDTFEAFINIEFVETETAAGADLTFNAIDTNAFLGVFSGAGQTGYAVGGLGWDEETVDGSGGLEQGGFGFITIIHEVGHALGLDHPHDGSVLPGVSSSGDTGDFDLNQGVYTTMSYIDGWATNPDGNISPFSTINYGWQGTPMAFDIAMLQDFYGANMDYATGDDVYWIPDANGAGTFFSCIWDAGGQDAMAYAGTDDVIIDLRAATLQVEEGGGGWVSSASGIYGGYTIAHGVLIEDAGGGSGNDVLVANEGDNRFLGGAGADTFLFVEPSAGVDRIFDFEDGVDLVDVSGWGVIDLADVTFGGNAHASITYLDQRIVFRDLALTDLSEADFVFA